MSKTVSVNINDALEILRSLPLFEGVDEKVLSSALQNGDIESREYEQSEAILSPTDNSKRAVIFLSGTAEVYSADKSRNLLLRTFERGQIVGVSNLFSEDDFPSRVIAARRCTVLEIPPEKFGKILESDKQAMYNFLAFLSGKIRYLNRKIVTLTAGSAERRLAYFLDTAIPDGRSEIAEITVQMNSLCEMLNLGRASLYRAADRLVEEGYILRTGKTIKVLDRRGMMEKYR